MIRDHIRWLAYLVKGRFWLSLFLSVSVDALMAAAVTIGLWTIFNLIK